MPFNLIRFLEQQNVEMVTSGPNVKKGNVYISCPMCLDDPSHHMGINENTFEWSCWRNPRHRGNKPNRLIKAILKCTWDKVDRIVGDDTQYPDGWEDFVEAAKRGDVFERSGIVEATFPKQFRKITLGGLTERFYEYVQGRFNGAPAVIDCYELKCALTGDFKDRIIIPLRFGKKLVGWTGRAIADAQVRYLTYPADSTVKKIIFDYDTLQSGGHNLIITEGPFDAINVDFHSRSLGSAATCLFGSFATEEQCALIASVASRWDRVVILLDPNAFDKAIDLQARLSLVGPEVWFVPEGTEDPATLTREDVEELAVR